LVVDSSSLNKVIVNPQYQFKSLHFRAAISSECSDWKEDRFQRMLTDDSEHMMPFERGIDVYVIQQALMSIYLINPSSFPEEEFEHGSFYGQVTQGYITKLKSKYWIANSKNYIDPVIGKKTIRALDFILFRNGN
jgi:hypothetical protein